jgi:serine/threonine protein kinase
MSTALKEHIQDYSFLLDTYEIPYQRSGSYYHAGELTQTQGWILHVTVVVSQASDLLKKLLPLLHLCRCAFKIIADSPTLMALNAGEEGYNRIGKVICIYPESDETALLLRLKLLTLLKAFKGPSVMTDYHLGGVVYTRYGSFIANNLNVEYGQPYTLITDGNGNQYYDQYTASPITPEGIINPFEAVIQAPKYQQANKPLHQKYIIKKPIAVSVKGNTLLASMKNGIFLFDCVIKQGRENMVADNTGRDIKDRLKWQSEVHRQLQKDLPIPKIYEYFEEEGDGYLSMEYIEGINLNYFILDIYRHSLWPFLPVASRKDLFHVMKQVISAIKTMHNMGYIHRDINSNNFIVKNNKTIRLIDLELAYNTITHQPDPPFESVTIGYGSAEQMALMPPTTEDDVYSIGALLILFFTGIEPMLIIEYDVTHLTEKLSFLTGSRDIAELIVHCLDEIPAKRPSLYHILSYIEKIANDNLKIKQTVLKSIPKPDSHQLEQTIWEALNGFLNSYLVSDQYLWVSGITTNGLPVSNGMGNFQVLPAAGRGIAGVLYMLSKARACGYDTYHLNTFISKGLKYCVELALPQLQQQQGGLYAGKEGIAVMMAAVEEFGLMELPEEYYINIKECFAIDGEELNLANGIAGKGLALIQCKRFFSYADYISLLDHYAFEIINSQEEDGSWMNKDASGKMEKLTGFDYGIAGIIYFLLEYCMESGDENAWLCISNGLSYLEKRIIKDKDTYQWYHSDHQKTVGAYWSTGVPGIALCFLKAFKVTGISRYKMIAEKALNFHPAEFVNYNLSLSNGMAGLGEIYLEAYDILSSEVYLEKANWIANLLIHMKINTSGNSSIWFTENNYCPAPDLMNGSSGIIHFLLRYRNGERLSIPLVL